MSLTISYDATNRTATQTAEVLIIPPANSADYNRIARMKPEEAAKAKLGNLKTQDIKNAVLGQSRLNYWNGSETAISQSTAEECE